MLKPPEVSVVMAARNADATIRAAIDSIVAQELLDWELIVVDDASQDGTRAVAESFGDPRIRVLTNDRPSGAARARNRAIADAGAPLIAIADADDVSLPTRLAAQVQAFEDEPALGVLGAQLIEFGDWGERNGAAAFPTGPEDIERLFGRGRMGIAHPAAMFRKQLAVAAGGYDEDLLRSEDLALFLRMRPTLMRALPQRLVRYRTAGRVGLRYVWREVHYAKLARSGPARDRSAVTSALSTAATTVAALRSWGVRRLREALAEARSSSRTDRSR